MASERDSVMYAAQYAPPETPQSEAGIGHTDDETDAHMNSYTPEHAGTGESVAAPASSGKEAASSGKALWLMPGEFVQAKVSSQRDLGLGMPRQALYLTNMRILMEHKARLFCVHDQLENTIHYEDILDVSLSFVQSPLPVLLWVAVQVAFLVMSTVAFLQGAIGLGIASILVVVLGFLLATAYFITEFIYTKGVYLVVSIFRPERQIPSWSRFSKSTKHASDVRLARLSKSDAYATMRAILLHPRCRVMPREHWNVSNV